MGFVAQAAVAEEEERARRRRENEARLLRERQEEEARERDRERERERQRQAAMMEMEREAARARAVQFMPFLPSLRFHPIQLYTCVPLIITKLTSSKSTAGFENRWPQAAAHHFTEWRRCKAAYVPYTNIHVMPATPPNESIPVLQNIPYPPPGLLNVGVSSQSADRQSVTSRTSPAPTKHQIFSPGLYHSHTPHR
jgi:hypothetical protein